MKVFREAIIVVLLLALTLAMNSTANAGLSDPVISVHEWMTGADDGQYEIFNDSLENWQIQWFAVENDLALDALTLRSSWIFYNILGWDDFVDHVVDDLNFPTPGGAEVGQVVFYQGSDNYIGKNQSDDQFFWSAQDDASQFWAGVSIIGADIRTVNGEAGSNGLNPIPEPVTLFLFGTGLAGIATIRRKRANKT